MKYRLLDILACPMCRHFPLRLIVFQESTYPKREYVWGKKPACELLCGLLNKKIEELEEEAPCEECIKREIVEGILICEACNRWYPIKEEIPIMLPDDLRNKEEDRAFLRKHRNRIPKEVLLQGKPFNIADEVT